MPVAAHGRRQVDHGQAVGRLHPGRRADGGARGHAHRDRRLVDGERGGRGAVTVRQIAEAAIERVRTAGEPARVDHEVARDADYPASADLLRQRGQRFGRAAGKPVPPPGWVAARLDDEVTVEDLPGDLGRGGQSGAPAVAAPEVLEGGRRRHRLEHRRGHEEAAGMQLVEHLQRSAVRHPRGEVAVVRAVAGDRRLGLRAAGGGDGQAGDGHAHEAAVAEGGLGAVSADPTEPGQDWARYDLRHRSRVRDGLAARRRSGPFDETVMPRWRNWQTHET